ncbi:uncharacterized protein JCM6883_004087 [Sporobolomyces salmoneus]|uniref:uncharacterized protein n=1 Tax=Sporobolomyces salmoneus TaxID=183962 RepID=UPI0031806D4B
MSSSLLRSLLRPSPLSRPPLSRPSSSSSSAHLLHPSTRQRLTNLTFYLCALVSIATVSLTMSGTLGGATGRGLPCPARSRVGAGAEPEREEVVTAGSGGKNVGAGTKKGKGRWLEDPGAEGREVWRAGKDGRLEKVQVGPRGSGTTTRTDGDVPTRIANRVREEEKRDKGERIAKNEGQKKEGGIAWRSWVGLGGNERGTTGTTTGSAPGGRGRLV